MIFKLYKWLIDWIQENPFLSSYIATIKGIIIGIIICKYFIK